jgi:hypothetical protein
LRVGVAKPGLSCLDVNALGHQGGSGCLAEVVEVEAYKSGRLGRPEPYPCPPVRIVQRALIRRNEDQGFAVGPCQAVTGQVVSQRSARTSHQDSFLGRQVMSDAAASPDRV